MRGSLLAKTGEGNIPSDVMSSTNIGNYAWSSIATGDYDGDGDADLLLSGGALTLYENRTGTGSFGDNAEAGRFRN